MAGEVIGLGLMPLPSGREGPVRFVPALFQAFDGGVFCLSLLPASALVKPCIPLPVVRLKCGPWE